MLPPAAPCLRARVLGAPKARYARAMGESCGLVGCATSRIEGPVASWGMSVSVTRADAEGPSDRP